MDTKIQTVVVRDSRLPPRKSGAATIVVPEGPSSVTYQSVNPADPTSTNPSFSIDMPSSLTGLQRVLYWQMSGSFTVTGTALNNFSAAERVALRQFPLQSMCSSLEVQINDTTVSVGALNRILPALLRSSNPSESGTGVQSATPNAPDWTSNYEAAVGFLNSPFRGAGDMEVSNTNNPPRTIGITGITINGGFTEMVVSFTVSEPIVIPPFGYTNSSREKAIYGVNQIKVTASMRDFHRGLSLAIPAGTTVTSVTMTPTAQTMLGVFVTPNDRSMTIGRQLALPFHYDYSTVNAFFTTLTAGVVNDGSSVTGSSNSFQLPVVPERLIIYAMYSETDRTDQTQSLCDAFMPITSIQVQAGTRSGLLAGATSVDLYALSHKNGAKLPYYVYRGLPQITSLNAGGSPPNGSGGPLVIDVAADLSLPDGMTPGMSVQWQFSVSQITCENRYGRNVTAPQLVVVAVTGGMIENVSGMSRVILGGVDGLNSDRMREAPLMASIDYHQETDKAGYGGSEVGDWFKKAGRSIEDAFKKASPALETIGKAALAAAPFAMKAMGGNTTGGYQMGGAAHMGGAYHMGGARLPRGSLYE